jgi:hypothetical protein
MEQNSDLGEPVGEVYYAGAKLFAQHSDHFPGGHLVRQVLRRV